MVSRSLSLRLMSSPYHNDVILTYVSVNNFSCFTVCCILVEDLGLELLLPGGFRPGGGGGGAFDGVLGCDWLILYHWLIMTGLSAGGFSFGAFWC